MNKSRGFPYILETHLVDHCNLNCKGCSHFSPLVSDKVFLNFNTYEHDLSRLRNLFPDVYEIRLMGGEPLLSPEINSYMISTRQAFPKANVAVFTNGLLLTKMPESFWEICAQYQISIKISKYPVHLDEKSITTFGESYQVKIKIPGEIQSFMQFINIEGNSDPEISFRNCRTMYTTPFLREGKLYSCSFAPHVHIFNEYFNQEIPISENDYIDIHDPHISPDDIFHFLDHPIPMCKWCKTRRPMMGWGTSKKEINEWIGGEINPFSHFFQIRKYQAISKYHQYKQISEMKKRNRYEH